MSRRGNCIDNAVIENFFVMIKSELFYLNKYVSFAKFKMGVYRFNGQNKNWF